MFHHSAEQRQPPTSMFVQLLQSCRGAPWDSTEQHLASVLVCGPSRTRLTLAQKHTYRTLFSVIFASVIQEGNHIMAGINKKSRAGRRKRVVQKHAHAQTPLF